MMTIIQRRKKRGDNLTVLIEFQLWLLPLSWNRRWCIDTVFDRVWPVDPNWAEIERIASVVSSCSSKREDTNHKIHLPIIFMWKKKSTCNLIVRNFVIVRFAVQIEESGIESQFMSTTKSEPMIVVQRLSVLHQLTVAQDNWYRPNCRWHLLLWQWEQRHHAEHSDGIPKREQSGRSNLIIEAHRLTSTASPSPSPDGT